MVGLIYIYLEPQGRAGIGGFFVGGVRRGAHMIRETFLGAEGGFQYTLTCVLRRGWSCRSETAVTN